MTAGRKICLIGEGMVELRQHSNNEYRLGYGGDTLNTAIHMARLGCEVFYATALGDDKFSRQLSAAWAAEGLDCSAILIDKTREVGLYAISVDAAGERSFTYWRNGSAARQMFALPGSDKIAQAVRHAGALAFSLVSLAILPDAGRNKLISLARSVREASGMVAFDSNYRPSLWENAATAALWRDRAIGVSSIGLPSVADEHAMTDGRGEPNDIVRHWRTLGCAETVVKMGELGCHLANGEIVTPSARLDPVDTSGAGDAFNGAYLAARLAGASPALAAKKGNVLASWQIMHAGAIPPRGHAASYPIASW